MLRGWRLALIGIAITALYCSSPRIRRRCRLKARSRRQIRDLPITWRRWWARRSSRAASMQLRNGDEVFPPMPDAIRSAQHRISFESFIYEDGVAGDPFTIELAAGGRGVTVRIVLDAVGGELSGEAAGKLQQAGVEIRWFNPIRPWSPRPTIEPIVQCFVIDGDVAFTGGIGLADHWLGHAQDPDHWRDTQFKVTGLAVRALEASFYENWLEAGDGRATGARSGAPRAGHARSIVAWSNPTSGASNIKLLYLLSIAAARERIDIESPHFILDESSRWALHQARQRGVRIRVVTDGEITDAMPVKYSSREGYQQLLDWGVEIYEHQPTMMHVKATMVDVHMWSVIGSANFDTDPSS